MPYNHAQQAAQEHIDTRAMQLNEAAKSLPQGDEREALLKKARKMEAASSIIDRWLPSPRLRATRQG